MLWQVGIVKLFRFPSSIFFPAHSAKRFIVKYNDFAIFCDKEVKLQEVNALAVGILKGCHCVFGSLPSSPAMGTIQPHWPALVEDLLVEIVLSLQAGAHLKEKAVGHAAIDAAT